MMVWEVYSMSKYFAEEKIIFFMNKAHSQAVPKWRSIYRAYHSETGTNKMKKGISNIVSLMQTLILKPALETNNIELLDEVLLLSKNVRKVFDKFQKHITEAMNDGIICNHGVLFLGSNYNNTAIVVRRRDPFSIAKYETDDGKEFVFDLIENKLWTEAKIYLVNNNKIVSDEPNFLGIIPFIFYTPHRIEFGGSQGRPYYESIYGNGEEELKRIQERLDNIFKMHTDIAKDLYDPSILHDSSISEDDVKKLQQRGQIVEIDNINGVRAFSSISIESYSILQRAEERANREFIEKTGQTDFTTGISTKTSTSGSLIEQMKESVLTTLKPFEQAYFAMFDSFVKKVASLLAQNNILEMKIAINDLTVEKWHKDINAQESLILFQNIMPLLQTLPNGKGKVDLLSTLIEPVLRKYATRNTDNPEKTMKIFLESMNKMAIEIEEINKQQAQQEQQNEIKTTQ